jgi:Thrombospondin type 1 domain.
MKPFSFEIAVNGGLSQWSSYSKCSKTCGMGTQTRSRTCTNPPPQFGGKNCNGLLKDSRKCQEKHCPGNLFIIPTFPCMVLRYDFIRDENVIE